MCHIYAKNMSIWVGAVKIVKEEEKMATWNSRGLRGSTLEDMINFTNEIYQERGLALVQKIPTPIKPIKIDKEKRHITLAYFEQKSTVDYIGAVQGYPICFDAKECGTDTFPLQNIHAHQIEFMKRYEEQGGISFMILYFTGRNEFYYLRFLELMKYWKRIEEKKPKNFKYQELDPRFFISSKQGVHLHYLETLNRDLSLREE